MARDMHGIYPFVKNIKGKWKRKGKRKLRG
jgi:hypothetical protein